MIEAAPSRSRHMRDHPIHYLATLLVGVEILVKKMAEKASALRDPNGISALDRGSSLRIVFQIGKKITHCRQPDAHRPRVLRRVNQFVNLAGNNPAIEMDIMRISRELALH